MMRKWTGVWIRSIVLGLMMLGLSLPVHAAPPVVVLSIKSIDDVLDDADYIGESAGTPGLKASAEQFLAAFTGGAGLDGVDREKPLGVYASLAEAGASDPATVVVFLPVSDVDALKKLIGNFAPKLKENGDRWELTVQGQPVFGRVADGYLYLSNSSASLKDVPTPEKIINSDYDIALEVNLAAIPAPLKQIFLDTTEKEGRKGLESGPPPKTPAEAAGQKIGFEWTLAAIKAITNDGDKLTFGILVDDEDPLVSAELGLTGKPRTSLASALAAYAKTTPAFSAVGSEDSPLRMALSLPTTAITEEMEQFFAAMRKTADDSIDDDETLKEDADKAAAKDVSKRIFNIIQATVKSGLVQSIVLLESGEKDTVRVLGGAKLGKGEDAGKLLDDIMKLSKESPDYAKVKPDVEKHAGARIHSIEGKFDDKQAALFGDNPGHLAVRADSLWFSLGGGNLDALKAALEASGKTASKVTAPISIRTKPATLVTLLEQDNEALVQRAEAIAGEPSDVFVLELVPTDKGGIKLKIQVGVGLVKLGMD